MYCNFHSFAIMDFYVTLASTDSVLYYAENKPSNFKVRLQSPLIVENNWLVGLTELQVHSDKVSNIYIYSNICTSSFVGERKLPLLRRTAVHEGWINSQFGHIYYIPVKQEQIEVIQLYINDENDKEAAFLTHTLYATLHIIKAPFIY